MQFVEILLKNFVEGNFLASWVRNLLICVQSGILVQC